MFLYEIKDVLLKKKRCVVMPNSVCIRSKGEVIFFVLMIFMEISPGCQMGVNFKTIRTACSAYSYPNSVHFSFSVFHHTFLVKLLASGSIFTLFWAGE